METMVAQVCMILANANRDSKKRPSPFKLADFLLKRGEVKRKQTVEEQRAAMENIARKLGAKRNGRD